MSRRPAGLPLLALAAALCRPGRRAAAPAELPDRGAGRLCARLHGQQRRDAGRDAALLLLDRLHRRPGQPTTTMSRPRPCCACSRCPAATTGSAMFRTSPWAQQMVERCAARRSRPSCAASDAGAREPGVNLSRSRLCGNAVTPWAAAACSGLGALPGHGKLLASGRLMRCSEGSAAPGHLDLAGVPALRIAILGLGYVGTTTAACLAKSGHHVLGIDINPEKVALIGAGRSPVVEPMVEELLSRRRRRRAGCAARCRSTASSTAWTW